MWKDLVLEAKSLACSRGGRTVFRDLNFTVKGGEATGVGSLDGKERDIAERHRPAAAQRVDGAGDVPRAHQKANSVTSGTWSDGRSQLRQASWTRCATA